MQDTLVYEHAAKPPELLPTYNGMQCFHVARNMQYATYPAPVNRVEDQPVAGLAQPRDLAEVAMRALCFMPAHNSMLDSSVLSSAIIAIKSVNNGQVSQPVHSALMGNGPALSDMLDCKAKLDVQGCARWTTSVMMLCCIPSHSLFQSLASTHSVPSSCWPAILATSWGHLPAAASQQGHAITFYERSGETVWNADNYMNVLDKVCILRCTWWLRSLCWRCGCSLHCCGYSGGVWMLQVLSARGASTAALRRSPLLSLHMWTLLWRTWALPQCITYDKIPSFVGSLSTSAVAGTHVICYMLAARTRRAVDEPQVWALAAIL